MSTVKLRAKDLKQYFSAKSVGHYLLILTKGLGLLLLCLLQFICILAELFSGVPVEDQKDAWMRQHRGGAGGITFRGQNYTEQEASRRYDRGDFYDRY